MAKDARTKPALRTNFSMYMTLLQEVESMYEGCARPARLTNVMPESGINKT
jgi:hypothetical protein